MEEWKDIGESNYQVSNFGNVRNKNGYVLKPKACPKKKDYVCYDVIIADTRGGKQKHHKIHQLVARAFIPNPDNRTEIDHIDRNPANNMVQNLRWATRSENVSNCKTRSDNALGEKNIYIVATRPHLFYVKKVGIPIKSFKTLDEAKDYRDGL